MSTLPGLDEYRSRLTIPMTGYLGLSLGLIGASMPVIQGYGTNQPRRGSPGKALRKAKRKAQKIARRANRK